MTDQRQMVTSQEFVTGLLCELALHDNTIIKLSETFTDERFERAFRDLAAEQEGLGLSLDFSLARNKFHGDSSTLRDTLYALRERGIVAINNPKFKTVEIHVDGDDAEYYLGRSSIPRDFLERVVERHFVGKGAGGGGSEAEAQASRAA